MLGGKRVNCYWVVSLKQLGGWRR